MMKKLTLILMALVLALSLTACKGKDGPVKAQEPDIPDTTTPVNNTPAVDPTAPAAPVDSGEPAASQPEQATIPDSGTAEDEKKSDAVIMASHTDVSLFYAGESFWFTVWDSNGNSPDAYTYTSADPAVAAVDEGGGQVTAVAPGITTVTAHVTFGGQKQDFDCIVRCRWEAELPGGEDLPDPSGQQPDPPAPAPADKPSLSGFFSTLQGTYEGLGMMMVLDSQLLDNYYPGLTDIDAVEEVLIQESAISTANVAVGLVRLSDDATTADVLKVQSIFQNRIAVQADGGAFYPASCETWENGVITSVSNCVGMFVHPDGANSMANLFTDTFSS